MIVRPHSIFINGWSTVATTLMQLMECESDLDPVPHWLEINIQGNLLKPRMRIKITIIS